jgi:hypothetical protein
MKGTDVHSNEIESFWSMFERGSVGRYYKMSPRHLHRYPVEFEYRQNQREHDTVDQLEALVRQMGLKRLRYRDLVADNEWSSGARSA